MTDLLRFSVALETVCRVRTRLWLAGTQILPQGLTRLLAAVGHGGGRFLTPRPLFLTTEAILQAAIGVLWSRAGAMRQRISWPLLQVGTATPLLAFTAALRVDVAIVQTTPLHTPLSVADSAIKFVLALGHFTFPNAVFDNATFDVQPLTEPQVAGFGSVVSGGGGRLLPAASLGPANFSGGNEALDDFATVSGGHANSATAAFSVVSGGSSNVVNTTANFGSSNMFCRQS